jgi:hypothetical protein
MKLAVPYIEICEVPEALTSNILNAISDDDWHASNYRKAAANMGDTSSVPIMHTPLCAAGCGLGTEAIDAIEPQPLYDKYFPLIEPILDLLGEHYTYVKYAAFLAWLKPRGTIGLHPDGGGFTLRSHRIHVPIKTNPGVAYHIDGKDYHWPVGKAFEFDNSLVHGVFNRSDEPRIHLVINLYPEEALK